jgi:sulfur-carrier protein
LRAYCRGIWCDSASFVRKIACNFVVEKICSHQQNSPNENSSNHRSNKEELIVPVTFHIPGALRQFTGGQSEIAIEQSPATVADALIAFWTLYPGIRDRVVTEQGNVREHINIFLGEENIRYTGGLATPIQSGSEISIVPAISGG